MAHAISQQAASYPLTAYNFRVDIGGETLAFTEVSGLVRQLQTKTYRHGLSHVEGEDIVVFEYVKKSNRETGPALIGITGLSARAGALLR